MYIYIFTYICIIHIYTSRNLSFYTHATILNTHKYQYAHISAYTFTCVYIGHVVLRKYVELGYLDP